MRQHHDQYAPAYWLLPIPASPAADRPIGGMSVSAETPDWVPHYPARHGRLYPPCGRRL